MRKQKIINKFQAVPLCSKCMLHEINSWINENLEKLNYKVTKKIREELGGARLHQGKCLVCNHESIAVDIPQRVLAVLEDFNVQEKTKKEFIKSFCF